MRQKGLDFFPLDCIKSYAIKAIMRERGGQVAFGTIVSLYQAIFASDNGYYLKIDKDTLLSFCQDEMLKASYVSLIINDCIRRDIFDKDIYQKYSVLTSLQIQEDYFKGAKRRKMVYVNENYLLGSFKDIVNILGKNVNINKENVNILIQRREEQRKEEFDNKTIEGNITIVEETGSLSSPEKLEYFKREFPNKVQGNEIIPDFVDIEKLVECIKNSSFIQKAHNFSLEYCCKPAKYEKILTNYYADDAPRYVPAQVKNDGLNFQQRTITEEEANNLFDNLEDLKI